MTSHFAALLSFSCLIISLKEISDKVSSSSDSPALSSISVAISLSVSVFSDCPSILFSLFNSCFDTSSSNIKISSSPSLSSDDMS